MSKFDIVVTGQLRDGFEKPQVQGKLAALFKCPPEKAARLIAGQPVVIKKGVDRETAERLGRQLHNIGLVVQAKRNQPATSPSPTDPTTDTVPQMTCPKCGTAQPKAESCAQCGILIAKYRPPTEVASAPLPTDTPDTKQSEPSQLEELEAFVGENFGAYRELFHRLLHSGKKYDFRWNWPAFLLTLPWLLYRKMYIYAAILVVLAIIPIPGLGFVMALLLGALGHSIYYHHCNKQLSKVTETGAERVRELSNRGGTLSIPVTIVCTLLIGMCISALVTKLFLGDQLNALQEATEQSAVAYTAGASGQTQAKMVVLAQTIKMTKVATEMQGKTYTPPASMSELRAQFNFDGSAVRDEWGTDIQLFDDGGGLQLISAGADRVFDTGDDLYQAVAL